MLQLVHHVYHTYIYILHTHNVIMSLTYIECIYIYVCIHTLIWYIHDIYIIYIYTRTCLKSVTCTYTDPCHGPEELTAMNKDEKTCNFNQNLDNTYSTTIPPQHGLKWDVSEKTLVKQCWNLGIGLRKHGDIHTIWLSSGKDIGGIHNLYPSCLFISGKVG